MERAGRFWKIISIGVGGLVAALVFAVILRSNGSGEPDSVTRQFAVTEGYTGVVWVGVAPSKRTIDVHIEWGGWAIDQSIRPDDPRTWRFDRVLREPEEPTLPIFVTVSPPVAVSFGYDSLPPGTRGLPKESWYPIDDET